MTAVKGKIGMIGLGAMGHSIAQNILKRGYSMVLYDLRPEAMEDLTGPQARAASSPVSYTHLDVYKRQILVIKCHNRRERKR